MKILILALGSRGDVQPYVALGAALKRRGHSVTLVTSGGFEPLIESRGLTAAPLSVDIRALIQAPEMQRALHSLSARYKAWRETRPMLRRLLDDSWSVAQETRPDVIVYSVKAMQAPALAEALGAVAIPSFQIPAFLPTGAFPSPLLPLRGLGSWGNRASHRVLRWLMATVTARMTKDWRRTRLGLPAAPRRDPYEGYHPEGRAVVRLHGYSRHLVPLAQDCGPQDRLTGAWFLDEAEGWSPPDALLRFLAEGSPPVYVGFGSMPTEDSAALTRVVLDALAASGRRGLLASGWGGLTAAAQASERVHVLDAAPHDWLFPRCSAVVHHGGAGTTHEGLRWGRPTVVCPVFGDQPFWGRRVAALGVGPAPQPQRRLTAAALARAIDAAHAPDVAARAAGIGRAIRAEAGAEAAAELVEEAARAGRAQ